VFIVLRITEILQVLLHKLGAIPVAGT